MAYGNWGAFVFRNGERMPTHEDQSPYREQEYEAGYHQAFGISNLSDALKVEGGVPEHAKLDYGKEHGPHHAVLGQGVVRLCGYKYLPVLFVGGEKVDVDQHATNVYDTWPDGDGKEWKHADQWEAELAGGYRFAARYDHNNMIDLQLVEPDGTVWMSRCGYCYGAGWDEDSDAQCPPPLFSS